MIRLLSYNIHKGLSLLSRRVTIADIKSVLLDIHPDIVFLQEIVGENLKKARRFADEWPNRPQFEHLADVVWSDFAYAQNAVYPHGHHGNAILSKYPIKAWKNVDISTNAVENRGLLHAVIEVPQQNKKLLIHALCTHLSLFSSGRDKQYEKIAQYVAGAIPPSAPVIMGGDFNDWNHRSENILRVQCDLQEVFRFTQGHHAKTFPSFFPVLCLDRMYVRNLDIASAQVHKHPSFRKLSDHLPLSVTFTATAPSKGR